MWDILKYYAVMEDVTKGKTPKYMITFQRGYFPEMEQLKGRDGSISFYLMENRKKANEIPDMYLQGKNSLNFTGLKWYTLPVDGVGYAYGNPSDAPTYGKDKKLNPFYDCRDDAYIFVIHQQKDAPRPYKIELMVLEHQKALSAAYCKAVKDGKLENVLQQLKGGGKWCTIK